ncbi:MAG: hypothetical protein LC799_19630, partial [Actinobacteria bacterium]|nr:hypothetical protein [Actinomycetota bacterium]
VKGALYRGSSTATADLITSVPTTLGSATVTYKPNANYFGADSFQFSAVDNMGLESSAATVSLSVNGTPDQPVAMSRSVTGTVGTGRTIKLTATDPDGDTLTISLMDQSGVTNGTLGAKGQATCTVSISNISSCTALIDYEPTSAGTDTFTFRANDGGLNSNTATVWIDNTVEAQPETSSVEGTAPAGGSVSSGSTVTSSEPVQTTVTSPDGGMITIEQTEAISTTQPAGINFLGQQINITAPAATVDEPLKLSFQIDGSLLPSGMTINDVEVFRNGTAIEDCTGAPAAVPNPCVASRTDTGGQIYEILVLTSHASAWNFGVVGISTPPEDDPGGSGDGSVDRTPPQAQVTTTTNRISPNGDGRLDDVTVSGTLNEPTDWRFGVAPAGQEGTVVLYEVSGEGDLSMTTKWNGRSLLSGSVVPDGVYTWILNGEDAAGNEMKTVTGTIIVDRAAPVVRDAKVRPNPLNVRRGQIATIKLSVFDKLSAPSAVKVTIRRKGRVVHSFGAVNLANDSTLRLLWNGRNEDGRKVRAGRYRIVIRATDQALNTVINRALRIRVR